MHDHLCGRLSGHGWPCVYGNKISLLSRFGSWVLDVWIVLNSYFSITLKKKDWSFTDIFYESVRGLKIVQNLLNTFQTTLFRTSACRRQPSWLWKERLATALLIDIDFIMAWLAYVQHSASENCLQRAVFTAYAHHWQKAAFRGTEIGVNFHTLFQSVLNITGRRDMTLFSTVILIEIGSKTHKKSINENR